MMPYLRLLSPRVWLLWAAVLALTLSLVPQTPPPPAHAQDTGAGSLDATFGQDGIVTSGINSGKSQAHAVAVLSDGKILVAGESLLGANQGFALARYTANGDLDTTFGGGDGRVTTSIGSGGPDVAYAIAVLEGGSNDGKILLAGQAYVSLNGVTTADFALARYTADGVLDTTFGTVVSGSTRTGYVTTPIGSGHEHIRAIVVQNDNKIVAAGYANMGATNNDDFALARYDANGTLDTSFDTDGKVTTNFSNGVDSISAVALDSNSKIVAAGISSNNFALARYETTGTLDTGFGTGGKVTTDMGGAADIGGVAVMSDTDIVAAGFAHDGTDFDFALARYQANGMLDTGFDTDGKVTTDFSSDSADQGFAMTLSDNKAKIVVAGGSNNDFALARYTAATGALDTTFSSDGKVTTPIGTGEDRANAVALSNGKIVAAGYSHNGTFDDFALARYTTAGALDTSFNTDGKVTTTLGAQHSYGYVVALQGDGKLVAAGYGHNGNTNQQDFVVTRFTENGAVDLDFGTGGVATADFKSGSLDYGRAVALQSDGKIVVVGRSTKGGATDFAVARFKTDGSLDTAFDTDGKVTTDFSSGEDRPYAVAVQSDGKIVVVGDAHNGTNRDFALARYDTNGSLDTGFGTGGKVTTNFGSGNDGIRAVAIQSDGKIVVAGQSHNGTTLDFTLARYTSAGILDTTFDTDGKIITASTSNDSALAVAIQSDRKILAAGARIVNNNQYDFALARYTETGALDTTFGTVSNSERTGWVTTPVGPNHDAGYGVLEQSGGRIVVTGASLDTGANVDGLPPWDFSLARYTDEGDLDTGFDTDGKVITPIVPGFDRSYGAVLQSGKVVLAGQARIDGVYRFVLARYLAPTDTTVSLSVSPSLMGQGRVDEGLPVTVTARLSAAQAGDVTIPLTVTDGTAQSSDYHAPRSITIPMGETSGTADITTSQDADTLDETFTVALGDPPSPLQKGSPSSVVVTIVDDDYPTAVTLTASTTRPSEGSTVTVRARLNLRAPNGGLTATFQVTGGTANEVDDYTLESGSDQIGEDEDDAETMLTIVQDTEAEGSETIELIVVVPVSSRGLSLTDQITLTIPANDGGVDRRTPPTPPTPTPRPTVGGVGGGGGGGGGGSRPRPTPTPVNTPPEFEEGAIVTVSLRENSPAGTTVGGPITATDPDGDDVRYELGGRDADLFVIDEDTGQITVAEGATLDYETEKLHAVTVTAEDIDGSGQKATIAVNINITNDDRLPGKTDNYDADGNGALDLSEVLTATKDYFDGNLTLDEVIAIIKAYLDSGS